MQFQPFFQMYAMRDGLLERHVAEHPFQDQALGQTQPGVKGEKEAETRATGAPSSASPTPATPRGSQTLVKKKRIIIYRHEYS